MERPVPGILREEIANPEPAGFVERVGITALILPWKKISACLTILALSGASVTLLNSAGGFIDSLQRKSLSVDTSQQLESAQKVQIPEADYFFQGNILTKDFNPVIMYDGGIIVNDVEGLAVAIVPSEMEKLISRLSWYNVKTTMNPILTVITPIAGVDRYVYPGEEVVKHLTNYEKAKRVVVYRSLNMPIPVLDLLSPYAKYGSSDYLNEFSYDLTHTLLRERIKAINLMNGNTSPVDISENDKELVRTIAPIRVTQVTPSLLEKAKSN